MEHKQLRVLVVDDNLDTVEALVKILEMNGYKAEKVHDGLEVVDAALRFKPDVVLLDVGLPGLNGYKVATLLRQERLLENTLLVGITGGVAAAHDLAAGEAGFDVQLVKPFEAAALLELLEVRGSTD